jgi:hypothetical protein
MTTAIAATVAFPKFAIRIASTRIAKFATAFVLAALLMLNCYFYVAANTINNQAGRRRHRAGTDVDQLG